MQRNVKKNCPSQLFELHVENVLNFYYSQTKRYKKQTNSSKSKRHKFERKVHSLSFICILELLNLEMVLLGCLQTFCFSYIVFIIISCHLQNRMLTTTLALSATVSTECFALRLEGGPLWVYWVSFSIFKDSSAWLRYCVLVLTKVRQMLTQNVPFSLSKYIFRYYKYATNIYLQRAFIVDLLARSPGNVLFELGIVFISLK